MSAEVVRQDLARQRAAARQPPERAMLDERGHPDDRVVPPVVRFPKLPEVQPRGEERPVDTGGELLDARVERLAPGSVRRGLDDACARIRLH